MPLGVGMGIAKLTKAFFFNMAFAPSMAELQEE